MQEHLYNVLQVERPPARRSAGLPYLLLGAMSSFSPQSAPLQSAFDMVIDASKPSTQSSDVIRTHAIHSLRVLLQDGRMTASTKPYIQAAFSVAIPGFGSKQYVSISLDKIRSSSGTDVPGQLGRSECELAIVCSSDTKALQQSERKSLAIIKTDVDSRFLWSVWRSCTRARGSIGIRSGKDRPRSARICIFGTSSAIAAGNTE